MMERALNLVVLGLSITSSWGNGHATTYRSLLRGLRARGHNVLFLERDVPWYADNRDLPDPPYCELGLYATLPELKRRYISRIRRADAVIIGSYVPQGIELGEWMLEAARGPVAFYDIDTPVTLAAVKSRRCSYINRALIRRYNLYLSFTGGPLLRELELQWGSPRAVPLYCSVDESAYKPRARISRRWDLGYLGTYSPDRQPGLEALLLNPARNWKKGKFVVAGPQYPANVDWPANVRRIDHLPPESHPNFYNAQRFTLNVTRAHMVRAGYSPSVRLFEAAACGTPIISDWWDGLETFFEPHEEILLPGSAEEALRILRTTSEQKRNRIGQAARRRVLNSHTAAHRAADLEGYLRQTISAENVATGIANVTPAAASRPDRTTAANCPLKRPSA